jgi:hypothetical protein
MSGGMHAVLPLNCDREGVVMTAVDNGVDLSSSAGDRSSR